MTSNIINQTPFLRTSRNFPDDSIQALCVELSRSYIDTAIKMNDRTIGLYPLMFPSITGDQWFFTGGNQKQQSLRQIFTFTAAGNVQTAIPIVDVSQFTPNCYGSFTDNTNWYGAIYASNVAIAGQVSFYLSKNLATTPPSYQITILSGAGAPAIETGTIVLEWITNV